MILPDEEARDALRRELAPHLNWDPALTSAKTQLLSDIYASIDDARVPGAIIPIVRTGRMSFGVVADRPADWRRLVPLVMAAVGVTLTDFDGRPAAASGPVGAILAAHRLEFCGLTTPAGDRDRAGKAVEAFHRLVRALQTMPVALRELPRSAPQILHEFDLALQVGDREASWSRLLELERRRAVDALNLRFLTVRWHVAFQQWQRLRAERWFADLCRTRRPLQVTIALLSALYEVDLGGRALLTDPQALLARFRTAIATEAGTLFHELLPAPPGPALLMLALDAVSREDERRLAALRQLPSDNWDAAERTAFEHLLALPPAAAVVEPEQSATDALLELQRSLADGQPLTDAQRIAIQALAAEDESLTLQQLVNALISDQPRQPLIPDAPVIETPAALPEDWVPGGWSDWFEALPQLSFQRARVLAERLADEVSVREYVATDADRNRLVRGLEEALSASERNAVTALPHLARWVQNDREWPSMHLEPLYRTLLTAFLVFDARTIEGLRSALSVLDGWLSIGPDTAVYREVLDDIRGSIGGLASERALDPLIDLAELLVVHPVPDAAARSALWAELQARLGAFQARMTSSQGAILNDLCDALEVPRAFTAVEREMGPRDALADWSGTVGVYTLRPATGQRVEGALNRRLPGANVSWRDDHVATTALRQLAARSDVMAVDWSAAKHSATNGIREALGQREPLWVRGGASSIVTDILNAIETMSPPR